jgi:UDP-GlcNAc:undecaprenyl-phosphate GlcNAc-1-phosphate transferase
MDMGWGKRRIAAFYWIVTAILGCVSLFLNGVEKLIVFITIALFMGIFFLVIDSRKQQQ